MKKCQSKLIRPSNKYVLDEGLKKGKIFSVEVKTFDSIYHASGKREALNIKVEFIKPNGELVYLYFAPTITWSPKGKLMKMLEDLDVVPAMGEELDMNALVGMNVTATIENLQRDGVVYSNIVRVQRIGTDITVQAKKNDEDSLMTDQLFDVDAIDFDNL